LKERLVRQPHDNIFGIAVVGLLGHARARQFGEADAEVDVRARIVRIPPALLTPVAREHDAAHVEGAFEAVAGWKPWRRVPVIAAEDLLRVDQARARSDQRDSDGNHKPTPHRPYGSSGSP